MRSRAAEAEAVAEMPSSVCSLGSSSNASSGRSRSHSRTRYRTKATSSEVDESLFGLSKNVQVSRPGSPVVILHDAGSARGKPLGWGRKPETIRLITRDLIRDLVGQGKEQPNVCLEARRRGFAHLRQKTGRQTANPKSWGRTQTASLSAHPQVAVNERKKSMKLKEILRKKNEKLNDLEEEAKKRAQLGGKKTRKPEMERRRLERLRIQAEIRNINDENRRRKEEKLNQERIADMRVLEYQRQKMAEQEKTRREKEMETARLRALQEKAQDHQAEQEKDTVKKKLQTEAMLKQSRLEQVAQKEHNLAIQVQRDRAEFERIVRIQREQIEKERKEHERRVALQMTHADELRRQGCRAP
ncbi:Coiled-coil domain-containing protein 19, mitochondrial, partial [Ophiophagus hannah]